MHAVQRGWAICRRSLGVGNSVPRGHKIQFARAHALDGPEGIAVLNLACKQPRDRLESGVRVGRNLHAAADRDVIGAVMISKTPRAHHRTRSMRDCAPNRHGANPAQRNLAGAHHFSLLPAWRILASFGFFASQFKVRHYRSVSFMWLFSRVSDLIRVPMVEPKITRNLLMFAALLV